MRIKWVYILLMVPMVMMGQVQLWKDGRIVYQSESNTIDSIVFPKQTKATDPNETRSADQMRDLDYLFDLQAVPEVEIRVTAKDWNKYLQNFDENPANRQYVPAQFTFKKDGAVFHRDSVGLRPRGNTSRRRPEGDFWQQHADGSQWHHAHFGVKFTEYTTGERFFGMDRLIFKWFHEDPSYAREIYCYDLFHRFEVWSAPHASYCRLSIYIEGDSKPVYMGVYGMIEGMKKGWLADRKKENYSNDNDGNLWKAAYGANLSEANKSLMGIADDYSTYPYNLKTNKDKLSEAQTELCNFITEMSQKSSGSEALRQFLEQRMDVDLFLRAYAVNVMVGMWDDYWINQNNYYFYFDTEHRFYFIPFDYDNTLGTGSMCDPAQQDMLNWGSLGGDRILMRKVMSIPEYKERYKSYIKLLAQSDDLFGAEGSKQRIRKWQQMIEPYVANDTGEDMSIYDSPASWGMYNYKLLSGGVGTNFFLTKINSISW